MNSHQQIGLFISLHSTTSTTDPSTQKLSPRDLPILPNLMLQFKLPFMGIPSYDNSDLPDHVQCVHEFLSLYFSFNEFEIMENKLLPRMSGEIKQIQKGLLPAFMDIKCFQQCMAYSMCSTNMGYWLFIILLNWMHTMREPSIFFSYLPLDWTNPKALH